MKPYVAVVLFLLAAVLPLTNGRSFGQGLDLPVGPPSAPTKGPSAPPAPPDHDEDEENPPSVFGQTIRTESASLYYVIDISGSMSIEVPAFTGADGAVQHGNRLDRAKAELIRSLTSLPSSFRLNILAYDCTATLWRPTLEPATPPNKRSATAWVKALEPGGGTGTGPAGAIALAVKENRCVVLLTDGAPNCLIGGPSGTAQDPEEHRQMIKTANTQGAVVDVFGIGASGPFREFCVHVAQDSGGTYVDVQ